MNEYKLINAIANVEESSSNSGNSGSAGGSSGSGGSGTAPPSVNIKTYLELVFGLDGTKTNKGIDSLTAGTTYRFKIETTTHDKILTGTMNVISKNANSSNSYQLTECKIDSSYQSSDTKIYIPKSENKFDDITVRFSILSADKLYFHSQAVEPNIATRLYVYNSDDEEMTSEDIYFELSVTAFDIVVRNEPN